MHGAAPGRAIFIGSNKCGAWCTDGDARISRTSRFHAGTQLPDAKYLHPFTGTNVPTVDT